MACMSHINYQHDFVCLIPFSYQNEHGVGWSDNSNSTSIKRIDSHEITNALGGWNLLC